MFQGVWFNLAASEPPTMHLVLQRCWCLISVSSSGSLVLCFKFYIVFNLFQHWRALSVFDAFSMRRLFQGAAGWSLGHRATFRRCEASAERLRKHWARHCSSVFIGHRSTSLRRSQNVDVFFSCGCGLWRRLHKMQICYNYMFCFFSSFGVGVNETLPFLWY